MLGAVLLATEMASAQPVLTEIETRYVQARTAEREARFADAESAYRSLTKGLPREVLADVRRRRARMLVKLERCTQAIALMSQVSSTSRSDRVAIAECHRKSRRFREALNTLEAIRADGREDADLLLRIAEMHVALRSLAQARTLLTQV